jgi:hypothetical protein
MEQIVETAIEIVETAITNGWMKDILKDDYKISSDYSPFTDYNTGHILRDIYIQWEPYVSPVMGKRYRCGTIYRLNDLLFSHPFVESLCKGNLHLMMKTLMNAACIESDEERLEYMKRVVGQNQETEND